MGPGSKFTQPKCNTVIMKEWVNLLPPQPHRAFSVAKNKQCGKKLAKSVRKSKFYLIDIKQKKHKKFLKI